MTNPTLFRDLLTAMASGCRMSIDLDADGECVEFTTDLGLQLFLMQTEDSAAVTLAIPLRPVPPEAVRAVGLGAAMLNGFDNLSEHGKVGFLPDLSAFVYLSKWRDYYGVDQHRICDWLFFCIKEAEECNESINCFQQIHSSGESSNV